MSTRLDPCWLGPPRPSGLVEQVSDFLSDYLNLHGPACTSTRQLEVEVKFGHIIDRSTQQRFHLPILSEVVLHPELMSGGYCHFESNMTMEQHQLLNQLLNKRVEECQKPEHKGSRVHYKHTRERDEFYVRQDVKLRLTRDVQSEKVLHCLEKQRIADLHVLMPHCPFDCRLSINWEIQQDPPPMGLQEWKLTHSRVKDRLSYRFQIWRLDLTQVKVYTPSQQQTEIRHELEMEVNDLGLFQQALKQDASKKNELTALVEIMVHHMRAVSLSI